jgi:hypothetical protein
MRLGTANIRNFPDMPRWKVRQDGVEMSRRCDLWGGQEIDPGDDDFEVIMGNVSPNWGAIWGGTNIPIFYKKNEFILLEKRRVEVDFEPPLELTFRPRWITGGIFQSRTRQELNPFAVVNCHLIAGARNALDPNAEGVEARLRQYRTEWDALQDFMRGFRQDGLSIFLTGDLNDPTPEEPLTDFRWLAGERLDRVGFARGKSVGFQLNDTHEVQLNSDHNGQVADGVLLRK